MRFKKQFEFHKVPEWDEYYLPYDEFCQKIEFVIKKMNSYRLKRIASSEFDLSESYTVTHCPVQSDGNPDEEDQRNKDDMKVVKKDDSLDYSGSHYSSWSDMELPLISLSADVKDILEEFIHKSQYIDEFYMREKNRIHLNFERFYEKFLKKVTSIESALNLEQDLKEHTLDELGYSSSWARQYVEFYTRFSWLDGFSKINLIAMQKILLKFDQIIDDENETLKHKYEIFMKSLRLSNDDYCYHERRHVRNLFAKHYCKGDVDEAREYLDKNSADNKHEDKIPLTFLLGMIVALLIVFVFFLLSPSKPTNHYLIEIIEIFPIFRMTLCFIFTLLCAGVVIVYLKEYRVNYVIIFESNPANRLAPSGMYILSAFLMVIWLLCSIGQVIVVKDYISVKTDLFALILFCTFFLIFFNPVKVTQSFIRFPIISAMISC